VSILSIPEVRDDYREKCSVSGVRPMVSGASGRDTRKGRFEEVTTAMTDTDIGGRVRDAREKRGLSLGDTARMTRLSPSIVQAIERNDFASLPAGMYRKAYLRTVAAEVGLDPLAIAADYDAQYDAPIDSATALIEMTSARNRCGEALHPSRRHAMAAWIVLAMLLAAWFAFRLDRVADEPEAVAQTGRSE
jgi:cytoskeletal protein RodZ